MSHHSEATIYEEECVTPSLPPLYFQNSPPAVPLPSELLTTIVSYLDWGDYARLAPVHSSFQSILDDAANYGGHNAKWTLAQALLDGTNGLQSNPSLAIAHLQDLAQVDIQEEESNDEEESHPEPNISQSDAMTQGFSPAMVQLGNLYLKGHGTPQNSLLGLRWLRAAARHGDLQAAHDIASIYEYGKHSVEIEIVLAAKWFLAAASAGHVESMAEYALCCELGCGVPASDDEALVWYTKAAERGHATSQFSMGEYFEGARAGLPQSDAEAVMWYYKAALAGDVDSKKALERLSDIARIVLPGWASTLNE